MSRCFYILLLMFTGYAAVCCAQTSALVFDMETRRCVPGVTVYVNPRGSTVTDRYGRFTITGECNSITLSHGSFEPLSLDADAVRDTIWLLPKARKQAKRRKKIKEILDKY